MDAPISEEAKDFIAKLLVKFQNKRLTASQCLSHPWLIESCGKKLKRINTENLKGLLARWRWQKAANALKALDKFTSLGIKNDRKASVSTITV